MCLSKPRKQPSKCGWHTHPRSCKIPRQSSKSRSTLPAFSNTSFQSYEREKEREVQRAKKTAHASVMSDIEAVGQLREKFAPSPAALSRAEFEAEKEREDRERREKEWQQRLEKLEREKMERERMERERRERERDERIQKLEQGRQDREERERREEEKKCRCEREDIGSDVKAVRRILEDDKKQREFREAIQRELEKMSGVGGIGPLRNNGVYVNNSLAEPARQGQIAAPEDAMDYRMNRIERRQRNIELDQEAYMSRPRRFWP